MNFSKLNLLHAFMVTSRFILIITFIHPYCKKRRKGKRRKREKKGEEEKWRRERVRGKREGGGKEEWIMVRADGEYEWPTKYIYIFFNTCTGTICI